MCCGLVFSYCADPMCCGLVFSYCVVKRKLFMDVVLNLQGALSTRTNINIVAKWEVHVGEDQPLLLIVGWYEDYTVCTTCTCMARWREDAGMCMSFERTEYKLSSVDGACPLQRCLAHAQVAWQLALMHTRFAVVSGLFEGRLGRVQATSVLLPMTYRCTWLPAHHLLHSLASYCTSPNATQSDIACTCICRILPPEGWTREGVISSLSLWVLCVVDRETPHSIHSVEGGDPIPALPAWLSIL
jgi:hypothetical protein